MNLIDKAYMTFSPEKGMKRIAARNIADVINKGYSHHGASRRKKAFKGWKFSSGDTKEDIDDNLDTLRQRSRDLAMGQPLAIGALKTKRTNVIGSGLKVNPQIDHEYLGMTEEQAREWEKKAEREFNLWAESPHCDAERMNNFYELQQLGFFSKLLSGECFSLLPIIPRPNMPYDLRVMLLEADRVSTPTNKLQIEAKGSKDLKIINGVEVGKYGEVLAYYVCNVHSGSGEFAKKEWKRVRKYGKETGRYNVIHLMEPERPGQRRGVPDLAPVIEHLKQLSDYTKAELTAAVISGLFTVFIESANEAGEGGIGELIPSTESVLDEDEKENNIELGAGAIIELAEGEKANVANPGRPNPNFDGFIVAICRQIGAAIELPYELLVKQFNSSYSASRASLLEAWKAFRMSREWMANDFCKPIYEEWLHEAVAKGRIHAPGFFNDPMFCKAYSGSEWHGPSQGQLDPFKEVRAAELRVKNCFTTRRQETVEMNGGDFDKNVSKRIAEEKLMREGGLITDEIK